MSWCKVQLSFKKKAATKTIIIIIIWQNKIQESNYNCRWADQCKILSGKINIIFKATKQQPFQKIIGNLSKNDGDGYENVS